MKVIVKAADGELEVATRGCEGTDFVIRIHLG